MGWKRKELPPIVSMCQALLRRDDRPRRNQWCGESPAVSYVFQCWRCGNVVRRPMCEYHAPVDCRPVNGDRWKCPQCREESKRLAELEERQRREQVELGTEVSWIPKADGRRGLRRHGWVASLGRWPSYRERMNGRGSGRTVWVAADDGQGLRLLEKVWWDPNGCNYSREEWQGGTPPPPVTVYEQLLRAIDQAVAEIEELSDRIVHDLVNELLPLPGESELYDRFDMLTDMWLELQVLIDRNEQLIRDLSWDELHALVSEEG